MESNSQGNQHGVRKFVRVPLTRQNVLFAALLGLGLVLFVLGLCLLARRAFPAPGSVLSVVMLSLGAAVLFCALALLRSGIALFSGLMLLLNGALLLVASAQVGSLSMRQLWPVSVIIAGVSIQLSSMYSNQRVRSVYLFPSILLLLLGASFLLFSLGIVTIPLARVILTWWPLILVVIGLVLIVIFLIQQLHHKDFPYMADDSLVEGDEE